jgi:hypothetical protein
MSALFYEIPHLLGSAGVWGGWLGKFIIPLRKLAHLRFYEVAGTFFFLALFVVKERWSGGNLMNR